MPEFEATLISVCERQLTLIMREIEKLNRALFGDIVIYDHELEKVVAIENEYQPNGIVGILNANSVVTYGQTNRNIPYYLFKPMNRNYPYFIVPYDKKKYGKKDLYIVVHRKDWPISRKYPVGKIMEYIGETGIYENEIEALLVRYDLPRKNISNRALKDDEEVSESDNDFLDLSDKEVFSIDPAGSEDIDDAIHIDRLENQAEETYEVGVHIANPSRFLKKDGLHDRLVQERLSSIYTPLRRIDMIHPDLAIEKASLIAGKMRAVNSILFKIRRSDKKVEIKSFEYRSALIRNRHNLSYEEAQRIYDERSDTTCPNIAIMLTLLFDLTDSLARAILPTLSQGITDVHQLIEAWMILTNFYTGRELVRRYKDLAPIRILEGKTNIPRSLSQKNMLKYLDRRMSQAAKYALYKENHDYHAALGISQYTHFTSPIRRYFDIIIHRMLFPSPGCLKYTREELCLLIDKINKINVRIRKAERGFDRLKIVKELGENKIDSTEKMILVSSSASCLELWSEKWQTTIKYRIIPRLLKQRYQIDNQGRLSKGSEKDLIYQFHEFEEIMIKSYPSTSGAPMELFHELVSPSIILD